MSRPAAPALLPLAALLIACPPGRGGGDDDDAGGDDFGGLDRDGDGTLDPDDVNEGAAASFVSFEFEEDGETGQEPGDEALETTNVTLSPGFEAWTLEAVFPGGGDLSYSLSLRFENLGTITPGIGAGDVTNGSMSPSDGSWYAYGNDPGGQVEITDANETAASGFFSGEATLDVLGEFEQPTGETVVVHGFAFNEAPLLVDAPGR